MIDPDYCDHGIHLRKPCYFCRRGRLEPRKAEEHRNPRSQGRRGDPRSQPAAEPLPRPRRSRREGDGGEVCPDGQETADVSRLALFLSLLWRPCPSGLGRLSWRTSWAVAGILRGRP